MRRNTPLETALYLFAGLLLVFPSLIEAVAEWIVGRDLGHTAILGFVIALAVLLKQKFSKVDPATIIP